MKTAISNIAWSAEEDERIYSLLSEIGDVGLEIAPKRIWDNPYRQSDLNIAAFNNNLRRHGVPVVAMQSLLFGHPELEVFGNTSSQTELYLKKAILLTAKLGAKSLVFGSPKNRRIGELNNNTAKQYALKFFDSLGSFASQQDVYFCLEPNPKEYGTDFITTTAEAVELIKEINNPGLKLNIDMGTMLLNGEEIDKIIPLAVPYAGHFHISEPFLGSIQPNYDLHRSVADLLVKSRYEGWVSVEMKSGNVGGQNISTIRSTLEFVRSVYGREK